MIKYYNAMGSHQRGQSAYLLHYSDVIMSTIASQITSLTIVYSTVYSGADQRKHQSSASLAFVWEFTGDWFPFDDVIMEGRVTVYAAVIHQWLVSCQPWWRHPMEIFSSLLDLWEGNPPVTGGFPSQRPVTRGLDVFFDLRQNKRLSKQPRRR